MNMGNSGSDNRAIIEVDPKAGNFLNHLKAYHVGRKNAIKAKQLAQFGSSRIIRYMTHELRMKGAPIVTCTQGYYIAEKAEELEHCMNVLKSYAEETLSIYNALSETKEYMKQMEGSV